MKLHIQTLHPDAKTPVYASAGASAFDLHALIEPDEKLLNPRRRVVQAGGTLLIRTGIAIEAPPEWGVFILSRSGHGFKHDVRLVNCVGLGDPDYRGEIMVKLRNDGRSAMVVNDGDRIAQAVLMHTPRVEFVVVDELSQTERGTNGFGSSGG